MRKFWICELYPEVDFMTGIALSTVISLSQSAFKKWHSRSTLARILRERLLKTLPILQNNSSKSHFKTFLCKSFYEKRYLKPHVFKWFVCPVGKFQWKTIPWQGTGFHEAHCDQSKWSMKHEMFLCIDFTTSCNNHSSLLDWLLKLQHTFFRLTHLCHQMSSGTKYLLLNIL